MHNQVCIPQITLVTTLAELYQTQSNNVHATQVPPTHLNAFPSSDCAMTSQIPQNKKYLYQDSELVKPWTDGERVKFRRILAIKILNVLSQRYSFVCGRLNVMAFDPETRLDYAADNKDSRPVSGKYAKKEIEKTLSVLAEHQRPIVHVNPGTRAAKNPSDDAVLAVAMPFDGMDHLPHLLSPDIHYELLSKSCLATSGLPTPSAKVIAFTPSTDLLAITNKHAGFFPHHLDLLTSAEQETFWSQVKLTIQAFRQEISNWTIPFVVKSQQSSSGGGTYLIRNEEELRSKQLQLESKAIPVLVSSVNSANAHLKPANLIITEYICAVNSSGVSFFVTQSGDHHFLSATRQEFDSEGFWSGGFIDYESQKQEGDRFGPIVGQTAKFLHQKGYYGPVGIDVLEDQSARLFVVDMNVRIPGSLPLGLLSKFFYRERGFQHGYLVLGVRFPLTRDEFLQTFRNQMEQGHIVIVAWYEDDCASDDSISWTNIAMADTTLEALIHLKQMVLKHSSGAAV